MTITLYHFPPSFPSRCAVMTAKVLGLDVDCKFVDLFEKEQLKPEFVKTNLQHTVPTLVDGDFTLWESRAIASYLVSMYGKDDSLYPTDLKKRALVDQRLYFDATKLTPGIRMIIDAVYFHGETKIRDENRKYLYDALEFLNTFLEGNEFVCGDCFTIADISLVATASSIVAMGFGISKFKNVKPWITRCSKIIPDYEEDNQIGCNQLGQFFIGLLETGQL